MKLGEVLSGPDTWCQGAMTNAAGDRFCLVGGLAKSMGYDPADDHEDFLERGHPVLKAAMRIARIADPSGLSTPFAWNDAAWRTWDEVAAVVEAYDRACLLDTLAPPRD